MIILYTYVILSFRFLGCLIPTEITVTTSPVGRLVNLLIILPIIGRVLNFW